MSIAMRRWIAGALVYIWLQIVFAAFGGIVTLLCAATVMLVCVALWIGTTTPNESAPHHG